MVKVSIVIPIYNVEKYIEKCVRSLMEQTFEDIEYIFVNDASLDNSISILERVISEYPDRKSSCIIINHLCNRGLTAARNTGLFAAKGEYILHFDSDDWAEKTMISDMYKVAVKNDSDIVSCNFRIIYDDRMVDYSTVDFTEDRVDSIRKYISLDWNVIWNLLVKRSIYIENNIQSLENYSFCEDFNLSVKLMLNAKKIVRLNKVLYNYNKMNLMSITRNLNEKSIIDERVMYMDLINYLKEKEVYKYYEKQIGWRILRNKQEWVLDKDTYDKFISLHPECHKYIWSCPLINFKLKVMMWTLTHHLSFISRFMLFLRFLRHGKKI
ncbi:glycosyltransferase family 2 protein [uncultured Bacteroides sp.]|uniref:glycosyltransferase family 2 protein n=2 Tax=Bacteroides TaxID=816 RepID=UPI00259A26EA|nr:glycosyltransferase family 2 protein [uncultured Bacteroides sp.]